MGIGDQILGTGLARGAAARGKKIAFGDGKRILWDANSALIFEGNPNIASPKSTAMNSGVDLEWIPFYKGQRIYNRAAPGRWEWNYDFQATPGEVFLTKEERQFAKLVGDAPFVIIEPNPSAKSPVANKRWPPERYEQVAAALRAEGLDVVQFHYYGARLLKNARPMPSPNFRKAMAVMERAKLYIGGEGGLHHAAAALGLPGVVIFGGFVPPAVTGYALHTNLTGGADACGSLRPCDHCFAALQAITVDEVVEHAKAHLARSA